MRETHGFLFIISWLLLGSFAGGYLFCQNPGMKYSRDFTINDYGLQQQNWWIAQDQTGFIYVANQGGVLKYDGVSWEAIDIPNKTARSLAINDSGTIFIGGIDELGFLESNPQGKLVYRSLIGNIEANKKSFGKVLEAHATKESVYFRTLKYVFRWNARQNQMTVIAPIKGKESFELKYYSQVCGEDFFVNQDKVGLLRVEGNSFQLIPGGERFASIPTIFMIIPFGYRGDKLLIGTREEGFFIYDGKRAIPYPTGVDDYLKNNKANQGIKLKYFPGDMAIATLLGGMVIIDGEGKRKSLFMKDSGLLDNNVKYLYVDSQGNLWAALNNGISKIEYSSPISIYDDRAGLPGIVLSVIRHSGELYAGTTQGLFCMDSGNGKFVLVSQMTSGCYSLLSIADSLLAATMTGVYLVKNKDARAITAAQSYILKQCRGDFNRVWVGTNTNLVSLYRNPGKGKDEWREEFTFEKVNREIRTIVEDPNGNLWLGARSSGVFKVELLKKDTVADYRVTTFAESHGLPTGEVEVFWAAGHVMFGAREGLFRFDEKENAFKKDDALGKEFSLGYVYRLVEDKNKSIWFHDTGKNYRAVLKSNQTYEIIAKPFARIPLSSQVNCIYPDPVDNVTWLASNEGLICFDPAVKKDFDHEYYTIIRRILVNDAPRFYDICARMSAPGAETDRKNSLNVFPFKERNIRVEFAAPFFEDEADLQFSYFLEGYSDNWSNWNKEKYKDFTNLDPGKYMLRVKALNVFGMTGQEAVFKFRILPPWYGTWWAYLIYVLIFSLAIFLTVRWRFKKLEQEKQKLELLVKDRTKEINRKNLQLLDQAERLKELDHAKSRFFAGISHEFRTPLTLIIGPLEQMLSQGISGEINNKLGMMHRNAARLLTLINRLLELSRIDSGKMKIQPVSQDIIPFLKGIFSSFEHMARENGLELRFHCEEESVFLYFDAEKMEEVFVNLLSNAVKFTPPGGTITVSVHRPMEKEADFPCGSLHISVKDTGSGIPQEELLHIFDLFYQADPGKHKQIGSGIGLALVRELVNLHHGKIDVHSRQDENSGTEFILRFPLGEGHLKEELPDQPIAPDTDTEEPVTEQKFLEVKEPFFQKGSLPPEATESTKNTILVVEDNPDMRQFIRESIEAYYVVEEVGDGREGIEKAQALMPDLIISDIMMPGIDGYELCQTVKNDLRTSHIPVIFLTAKASDESRLQGLETRADDYITKPFNNQILLSRIKNLIDLRRQLQEKFQRRMRLEPAEIDISSIDQKFLEKLHGVIEEYLSDSELNVESLSEKMDISRVTLNKKILALTGETANEFIRSYRLKRAVQLLEKRAGNITDIAMEVGFSSSAYFTKCFKEKFNRLPSEYLEGIK